MNEGPSIFPPLKIRPKRSVLARDPDVKGDGLSIFHGLFSQLEMTTVSFLSPLRKPIDIGMPVLTQPYQNLEAKQG